MVSRSWRVASASALRMTWVARPWRRACGTVATNETPQSLPWCSASATAAGAHVAVGEVVDAPDGREVGVGARVRRRQVDVEVLDRGAHAGGGRRDRHPGVAQLCGDLAVAAVDPDRPAADPGVAVADLELVEGPRRGGRVERDGSIERGRVRRARDDRGDQARQLDHEALPRTAAEERLKRGEA